MMFKDEYAKQAKKDVKLIKLNGLKNRVDEIIQVIRRDPYEPTPGHYFEELTGNLNGAYSRRINYQNRFVYTVHPNTENAIDPNSQEPFEGIVRVHTSWGHKYPPIPKNIRDDRLR